jgi:chromate transporter
MRRISVTRLFKAFAWIGLTGLGGGRIAYLYDDLVERRRWLTQEEFLPGFALSQLLPGPTLSNLSIILGSRLKGSTGAVLALLGTLLPGLLVVLLLSAVYFGHGMTPDLAAVLRGMGAAVAGFVTVVTGRMARAAFRGVAVRGAGIAVATFVAAALLQLNSYLVVLVLGAASLWLHRPGSEREPTARPEQGP